MNKIVLVLLFFFSLKSFAGGNFDFEAFVASKSLCIITDSPSRRFFAGLGDRYIFLICDGEKELVIESNLYKEQLYIDKTLIGKELINLGFKISGDSSSDDLVFSRQYYNHQ